MSLIKKINDPNGKQYDDISIGALVLDTEPIEGSFNPVTSDGVKNAVDAILPAGTSKSNPLMNAADTERMIAKMIPIAANTLRFYFPKKDYDPTIAGVGGSGTWKKITKYCNVWDWTRSGNSFSYAFDNAFTDPTNIPTLIAAGDTSSVTNMEYMFRKNNLIFEAIFDTSHVTAFNHVFNSCADIKEIPLFDLSSATNMQSAFNGCSSVKKFPLFNTSNVTNMSYTFAGCSSLEEVPLLDTSKVSTSLSAFNNCTKVKSGALALYTQMSTQTTPPSNYAGTFTNCGKDTTTGAAELAQIPASWGGTAP